MQIITIDKICFFELLISMLMTMPIVTAIENKHKKTILLLSIHRMAFYLIL